MRAHPTGRPLRPLLFAAAVAAAAAGVLAMPAPAAAADETFEKAYSLDGVERVRIENVNGSVELKTWDKPYVRLSAVKSGSPSALSNTVIRVTQPGSEIRVETIALRSQHFFSFLFGGSRVARVEYTLLAPATVPVRLETVNGSVRVDGRRAEVRAETVNGGLDLRDIQGPVNGETVNGRITLECVGSAEETHLETVNGSIEATYPAGASLRYRLSSINGRLEAGEREMRSRGFGGHKLEGEINGGRTLVHAETVNGGIRVTVTGAATAAPAPVPESGDKHESDE